MKPDQERPEEYKMRLEIALKAAKICVFEVDIPRQAYIYFFNAWDIFHVSDEKILKDVSEFACLNPEDYQKAISDYFSHPGDQEAIDEAFRNIYSGLPASYEARMRAGGSSYRWCRIDATPVLQDGVPGRMIGVITDIDKLKQETFALEKAVMLDSFTGLYNKKRFIELSERILTEHQDQSHALLLLDIDNFKQINDTLGHQVGDQVLRRVSEMLREAFQERDIVGRFGGDEFVVLCRNLTNWEWLVQKLEAILCCGEVRGIVCTNSVGIALFPGDAANFYQLLENADVALYQSKQRKRAYTFYTKE